jgi:SAM-dependent methyltransferase
MKLRVVIGEKILSCGEFIQSLAVTVMRPGDLIEFGRRAYAQKSNVAGWASEEVIRAGLNSDEEALLKKIPLRKGRLLLLGVGGGREAIPLARSGFAVTGLDFIPEMVEQAKENALRHGVTMDGLVQELSRLDLAPEVYDIVWLSAAMYSCIPTRRRRTAMLRKIHQGLTPGGFFVCQFYWDETAGRNRFAELLRKAFAFVTLGNFRYEAGDKLWFQSEFIHAFSSRGKLRSEFIEAGFAISDLAVSGAARGGAVLEKPICQLIKS